MTTRDEILQQVVAHKPDAVAEMTYLEAIAQLGATDADVYAVFPADDAKKADVIVCPADATAKLLVAGVHWDGMFPTDDGEPQEVTEFPFARYVLEHGSIMATGAFVCALLADVGRRAALYAHA